MTRNRFFSNWAPRGSPLSPCAEQRFPDSCPEALQVDTPGATPVCSGQTPSPSSSPAPAPDLTAQTPSTPETPVADPLTDPSADPSADPAVSKQGSPFYAEPADAIRQTGPAPRRRCRPPVSAPPRRKIQGYRWIPDLKPSLQS